MGVNAGGEPPHSAKYKIILTGNVPSSEVAIVDMRAKITRRSPPSDGAFLMCGWGMGMEPDIPFKFDLTKSDTAPATIRGSS